MPAPAPVPAREGGDTKCAGQLRDDPVGTWENQSYCDPEPGVPTPKVDPP